MPPVVPDSLTNLSVLPKVSNHPEITDDLPPISKTLLELGKLTN